MSRTVKTQYWITACMKCYREIPDYIAGHNGYAEEGMVYHGHPQTCDWCGHGATDVCDVKITEYHDHEHSTDMTCETCINRRIWSQQDFL